MGQLPQQKTLFVHHRLGLGLKIVLYAMTLMRAGTLEAFGKW